MKDMPQMLCQGFKEIEFEADDSGFCIEGHVYIKQQAIKFGIYFWLESSKTENETRVEFMKKSGNPMDFEVIPFYLFLFV